MMIFKFVLIFLSLLAICEGSRILIVHTSLSKSHAIPLKELAKVLAKRGHEITFISPFPLETPMKNYRDIKVTVDKESLAIFDEFTQSLGKDPDKQNFLTLLTSSSMIFGYGNQTLQMDEVQNLMKSGEKFDLVITSYFLSEYLLGLADHFKCPSIVFFSAGYLSLLNKMVGNPLSVSGAPHFLLSGSNDMNFMNRLKNFFINGIDLLVFRPIILYKSRQIYEFNFPPDRYRSFDDMMKNISMVLINSHFATTGPRPNLPNMVEVGGLQVNPEPSPLPKDMQKFLDDAHDGAILFSFGSNAKSIYIAEDKLKAIIAVFGKLKQRVIMKWESDEFEGKPENVFVSKWLPQTDVLAHPNIKIFVSHCGLGGVIEAKFHGVPIIGIPLGGDQHSNAKRLEEEGWGIQLNFKDVTEESLMNAINKILSDSKYSQTVKKLSVLSKDRPMSAQQTAAYWVEYVIRHRGAPHMHYPAADFNFIQDNSIDVMLFIIAVIYGICKLIKIVFKAICCRKKSKNVKVKFN